MRWMLYFSIMLGMLATMASGQSRDLRVWTNNDGNIILAKMVSFDGENVVLKLREGPFKEVVLSTLSAEDQAYVRKLDERGLAGGIREMPEVTEIVPQVEVTTEGRVFKTQNYRFETDRDASKAFIREAAQVFEGTVHAIKSLPFGIDPVPPEGQERFHARFVDRGTFVKLLQSMEKATPTPIDEVAGIYLPEQREIVVPYKSFGAANFGSKVTVTSETNHSILIHEIAHQLLHNWDGVIPTWFGEGFSEYMAAVPYSSGRFEFRRIESGIANVLHDKYDNSSELRLPAGLSSENARRWGGTKDDYKNAMLTFYYLVHRPGETPGHSVTGYFKVLDRSKKGSLNFIGSYNQAVATYQAEVEYYNQEVNRYNAEMQVIKEAVAKYKDDLVAYNDAIRSGVPLSSLTPPSKPNLEEPAALPAKPKVPEILTKNKPTDQPLDILADANKQGREVILNGATPAILAKKMERFFEEAQIPVTSVLP